MAASFALNRIPANRRHEGPIACPSLWRGTRKNGAEDPNFEIRVLAPHPDGGYLYEWRRRGGDRFARGELGHAPEGNLRRIFRPTKSREENSMSDGISDGGKGLVDDGRDQVKEDHGGADLLGTTDPQRWAIEFEEAVLANVDHDGDIDRDVLVGWFANAMQAKESSILGIGTHKLSTEELHELVFEVGGAATAPCLAGAPELVMPAEEVIDGINAVLATKGYPTSEKRELPE